MSFIPQAEVYRKVPGHMVVILEVAIEFHIMKMVIGRLQLYHVAGGGA
jgi:hypothetical protein